MKKMFVSVMGVFTILSFGYLVFSVMNAKAPSATAAKKTYTGVLYVAGMGGHFAKAEVTVDPNNADAPIHVNNLDRVVIGTKDTHPTHDARVDVGDPNTLFWSTYVLDPQGKMHVGKSDLKTGDVIKDVALDPDKRAPGDKPPLYCASGQTKQSFLPVFMGTEGFIDVFDKKSLELKHRMFVSDLGYKPGTYIFVHGINSNDMKKFAVVLNQKNDEGKANGKVDFVLVDLPSLERGKWKVLAKNTLTGEPRKTLTFREFFSTDDTYLYQSAGDRLWVLDGKSLKLVDEKMIPGGGQIHDAMPTPDNKYVILTVRNVTEGCDASGKAIPGKEITDGVFLLYDAEARKITGKSASACLDCHKNIGLGDKSAILCGLDGVWRK
ncbi:MAG: hypothetical protein K8I29_03380 [Alphaproteobacteria bacterium]|uniref:Uncharacterized protein n=1 Tax=Candidatus Nitrobium versatile TaxID=2884831 RepID=A0A953J9Z6_9BACT|nr:hypothetical protein [Candidatus Nitrobium versatile]